MPGFGFGFGSCIGIGSIVHSGAGLARISTTATLGANTKPVP
ncbi:hypothetical protein [Lysobacter gummosus]